MNLLTIANVCAVGLAAIANSGRNLTRRTRMVMIMLLYTEPQRGRADLEPDRDNRDSVSGMTSVERDN